VQIILGCEPNAILHFARNELEKFCTLFMEQKRLKTQIDLNTLEFHIQAIPQVFSKKFGPTYLQYLQADQNDSYGLYCQGNQVYFFGKHSRGVLYGVYDFLKILGFRWYFPDRKYELVKTSEFILNKISKIEIPAIARRGLVINGSLKTISAWIDYAGKNRLNVIALNDVKWYYRFQDDAIIRGIDLELYQRTLGKDFCTTEKRSFARSLKQFQKYMESIPPSVSEISCFHSGGDIDRCTCAVDPQYNISDRILFRTNLLINTNKVNPHQKVGFLAEMHTWKMPLRIRPHPQVNLVLSPKHRCYSHSIDDPFCKLNKELVSSSIKKYINWFERENNHNRTMLGHWLDPSYFGANSFEAFGFQRGISQGRLPHLPRVVARDIQYCNDCGFDTILSYCFNLDETYLHIFTSPTICLFPLLLWNPRLDIERFMGDFCLNYFNNEDTRLFYDQGEILDPKDINLKGFKDFLCLTKKRRDKFTEILQTNPPMKVKKRLEQYSIEQNFKLGWKKRYILARIKGIIDQIKFQITQMKN
jgi:hypothetical protein